MPDGTPRQIAQLQATNLDAHEAEHLRPNGAEQAPDLAVPTLAEDDFEPCVSCAGTEQAC